MCKIQVLRDEVKQRLNEAVRDVFELFERTIDELAEELRRSKEENQRQRHLLDTIMQPRIHLERTDGPLDEPAIKKEAPVGQQKPSFIPDQTSSQPPVIKKEPEELLIRQVTGATKEEQSADIILQLKDEPDCSKDEEEPQSSQWHESGGSTFNIKTEVETVNDYRGSELASLLHTDTLPSPQPVFNVRVPNPSHDQSAHMETPLDDEGNPSASKPFMCPLCGKSFRCRSTFRYHIRIHSGEKPFCCSICGHKFRQRSDLSSHYRVHTGYKPFSCTLCSMTFSRSYSLGLHMRTHTGEKPFACNLCLKRFTWKSQLNKHNCVSFSAGVDGAAHSGIQLMQQEMFYHNSQFQ